MPNTLPTTAAATMPPDMPAAVRAAFLSAPEPARQGLLHLRALILQVAAETPQAGRIEEALRWGQPAYLTPDTRSGSTLRLGAPKSGGFAIYAHCQTTIIADFQAGGGAGLRFEGNRAVLFDDPQDIRPEPLALMIRHALTYHLRR